MKTKVNVYQPKMIRQRGRKDCTIAAWATANSITYSAARKFLETHHATAIDGFPDRELRFLVQREFGEVSFPRLGHDDRFYPIQLTWGQWLSEHQTGRYLVSVWSLAMDGLYGDKHCVAVIDGICNDRNMVKIQVVDWWAEAR